MPDELLAAVDHEAKAYYMTRSDLIRRALIWYLQPNSHQEPLARDVGNEHDSLYSDPEELLKILHHQRLLNGVKSLQRDMKRRRMERNSNK